MNLPSLYAPSITAKIIQPVTRGDGGRSAKSIRWPLRAPFGAKAKVLAQSKKPPPISGGTVTAPGESLQELRILGTRLHLSLQSRQIPILCLNCRDGRQCRSRQWRQRPGSTWACRQFHFYGQPQKEDWPCKPPPKSIIPTAALSHWFHRQAEEDPTDQAARLLAGYRRKRIEIATLRLREKLGR